MSTSAFADGRLGTWALRRPRLWLVVCLLAVVIPPSAAWASTQYTYVGPSASICCWTGYSDGGTYVSRDYNNIYHACSSYTANGGSDVEYQDSNGFPTADAGDGPGQANCVNPSHLGATSGTNQRSAHCGATNGGSTNVTNVTCQTSRP